MKKLLYLLLIALSLTCLSACGANKNSETSNTDSQSSETELSWEEEMELEKQKWVSHWSDIICDTWQPRVSDKELGEVIISKDGTFTIAGNTYPYQFTYADEFSFSCYAYDEDTIKYSLSYTKADPTSTEFEKQHEKLSVMVPNGENSYTTADGGGMFYRKSSYEGIEITAENWDTYFELVTVQKENVNEFGEVQFLYLDTFYKIKEEYNNQVNCYLSDVVFEVKVKECNYDFTFDIANKTYTLGERDNDREDIDTRTYKFGEGHYSGYKEISYLSDQIQGTYIHADRDYISGYFETATVLRATGTLYISK